MNETIQEAGNVFRKSGIPLSLLMVDIDFFKAINDKHGHTIGDEILKDVARNIARCVGSSEKVFRYGGEEFAIVLERANEEKAAAIAENLRVSIAAHSTVTQAGALSVTVSIGGATLAERESTDSLIRRADEKLYLAKEAGRNRTIVKI